MTTYIYTRVKRSQTSSEESSASSSNKRSRSQISSINPFDSHVSHGMITVGDECDIKTAIFQSILQSKRERRFLKLSGMELPSIYDPYLSDPEQFKGQLCSIYEVVTRYDISNIRKACYGCQEDLPSQDDHQDCLTGCLHDPSTCVVCTVEP